MFIYFGAHLNSKIHLFWSLFEHEKWVCFPCRTNWIHWQYLNRRLWKILAILFLEFRTIKMLLTITHENWKKLRLPALELIWTWKSAHFSLGIYQIHCQRLKDVPKNFWSFILRILDHEILMHYNTRKSVKSVFTCFGLIWTWKCIRFSLGQLDSLSMS